MPDDDLEIIFPLRSNAHSLLAGAAVEAVRRRLKFASLVYEHVLLEAGSFVVEAGPGGASTYWLDEARRRFQAPRERRAAKGRPFIVGIHEVDNDFVEPLPERRVESETIVSWHATFFPFGSEFARGTDWVEFLYGVPSDETTQLARDWATTDLASPPFEAAMPVPFLRELVVKSANYDLALSAVDGMATSMDPLHRKVLSSRFGQGGQWAAQALSIPFLFPDTASLGWSDIRDLRRNRHMRSFRAVMREVEETALREASGGDLEAASHHAYERMLADAAGPLEGLRSLSMKGAIGLTIGTGAGFVTAGFTGPLAIGAGASLGAAIDVVRDAAHVVRQRKQRGWTAIAQSLARANPPTTKNL